MRPHGVKRYVMVGVLSMVGGIVAALPADAATPVFPIVGDGSTWSANAVDQWVADESAHGVQIAYTATGSAQGRSDFAHGFVDFAVTDLPYQGGADNAGSRQFDYVPIVAGGTAFAYHVSVGGQLVRDLKLSGATLAGIFTGTITDWSDPAITADNNGRQLPGLAIVPVLDSQPADTSFVFTQYLASNFPAQWSRYSGLTTATATYPITGAFLAQNGSDAVMNLVTSAAGNGTIGLDQYSYALARNVPVVAMGARDGTFALPTATNVTAGLDGLPNGYPLSSDTDLLLPIGASDPQMTTAKRQALADFLAFALCQGQGEVAFIGYAPLPQPLIREAFTSVTRLHTADPAVTASAGCDRNSPIQIPMTADDGTPPYTGQLSLVVTAQAVVPLTQIDPTTAPGHPAVATDRSGHRHAWVFNGDLSGITINDTRPAEPGWTLTADATDFTGPAPVTAADLGWTPRLVAAGSDSEGSVLAGDAIAAALASVASTGLSESRIMGSAGPGSGLGTTNLGATLIWWVPDTTPQGTYTSTLTLTLTSP